MTSSSNPFEQYGIKSLSIPTFYNKSSLSGVSSLMTREFYQQLNSIQGLKLNSGLDQSADAVLVGVISSSEKLMGAVRPSQIREAQTVAPNAVADRRSFYIPTQSTVMLRVQVFVIKRPTKAEIELLQTELGSKVPTHGKIVFNEVFNVSRSFDHEIRDGVSTSTNFTQTRGGQIKTLGLLAEDAARNFKEMVLYAF
jgi:hypothetical protein